MKVFVLVLVSITSFVFAQTPKLLWEIQGHNDPAEIVISQDGKRCGTYGVSFHGDQTIKLWSIKDKKLLAKTCYIDPSPQPMDFAYILGISLSPRGEHAAIHGSHGEDSMTTAPGAAALPLWVFTADGAYLERIITWDHKTVSETRDSLDENWLALSTFLTIRDVATGDTLRSQEFIGRSLHFPLASPNNTLVAYYDVLGNEIVLVDITTASITRTLKSGQKPVAKAFSLDGTVLTVLDADSTIRRWNTESGALLTSQPAGGRASISNEGSYYCMMPAADSLVVYRTDNGAFVGDLVDHTNGVLSVNNIVKDPRFGPQVAYDGTNLFILYIGYREPMTLVTEQHIVYVGVVNNEDPSQPLNPARYGGTFFTRGGEFICLVTGDGMIEERRTSNGVLTRTFKIDLPDYYSIGFVHNSHDRNSFYVAIASYTNINIPSQTITLVKYDATTFEKKFSTTWDRRFRYWYGMTESPDGQFLYIAKDTIPYLVRASTVTGDTTHWLNDTLQKSPTYAVSPDSKEVVIWHSALPPFRVSTETGELIKDLQYYYPLHVQYHPSGKILHLSWPQNYGPEYTSASPYMLYDIEGDTMIGSSNEKRELSGYYVGRFYWLNDGNTYIAPVQSRRGGWGDESGGLLIFNPFTQTEQSFTFMPSGVSYDGIYSSSDFITSNGIQYLVTRSFDGTLGMWEIPQVPSSVQQGVKRPLSSIYPNPAEEAVAIQFDTQLKQHMRFIVSDVTGKAVDVEYALNAIDNTVTFDVKDLPPGVYVVHAADNPGLSAQFVKMDR